MSTVAARDVQAGQTASTLTIWSAIGGAVLQIIGGTVFARAEAEVPDHPASELIVSFNAVSHLLLLVGLVGLARSGAAGRGRVGRWGIGVTAAGLAGLVSAEYVWLVETDIGGALFGISTLLLTVGLVLFGVAVLRAGQWAGWRRYAPVIAGGFGLLVLAAPAFELGAGFSLMIAAWGACWLLMALALRAESRE